MTTPATRSPTARAASTVSSVWLIVPSPGRAATTTGSAEVHREVAHRVADREWHEQAADPLADQGVGATLGGARAFDQPGRVDR